MEVVRTRVKGVYRKLVLEVRALGVRVWYDWNTCRLPRTSRDRPPCGSPSCSLAPGGGRLAAWHSGEVLLATCRALVRNTCR